MKVALFSQSLFSLDLSEAIAATAKAGFAAIELACREPHFGLERARREPEQVGAWIRQAGLRLAALSLFSTFSSRDYLDEELESAATYMRLAPLFETELLKLTPGPPASSEAAAHHWRSMAVALEHLVPLARKIGVRLAFETHMKQLTDTLASARRFLEMAPADVVGLTVDFSNLSFAGEEMSEVISALGDRIYHTHLKNGFIDSEGGWHFCALDEGLTRYSELIELLRNAGYGGYLSIECLGEEARRQPLETARRDLSILRSYLGE